MSTYDQGFEAIAGSLSDVAGHELTHLLASATHVARSAICITDAQLDEPGPRIVYVNPAFERMTGYQSHEVLGRSPRFLHGPDTDRLTLDRLRRDLGNGRAFQGETSNYRKDGTRFTMTWRIAAITDATGRPTHYVSAQDDVTSLREAESRLCEIAELSLDDAERLTYLVSLGVTLAHWSDPDDVLQEVARAAVEHLEATWASVVLVDGERHDWAVAVTSGPAPHDEGSRFLPLDGSAIAKVLDSASSFVESAANVAVGAGIGVPRGAVAVLPLGDRAEDGVLLLAWNGPRDFWAAELHHLEMLARLATMTYHKTQALERQRDLATELQAALLPSLPEWPDVEVAWRYVPAADHAVVGGDWYDAVRLPTGATAFFVGDMVGHGAEAAALMGELRFTTRGLVRAFHDPARMLDELDRAILADHPAGQALATLAVGILEPDGTFRYSVAGHPAPAMRRADGGVTVLDGGRSRLLGVSDDGERSSDTVLLRPGDVVVMFSDGAFETRGEDIDQSYDTLLRRLADAEPDTDAQCDAALGATAGSHRDDVVALALQRRIAARRCDESRPTKSCET